VEGSAAERRGPRAQVDAYLAELAGRAREVLGERLVGVYAGGSLALGAYEQGRSDLDVAVVVEGRLPTEVKEALVVAWRHESLACPARGLELVAYSRDAAASPSVDFELNLNMGRGMAFRADFAVDPAIGTHWFAIDDRPIDPSAARGRDRRSAAGRRLRRGPARGAGPSRRGVAALARGEWRAAGRRQRPERVPSAPVGANRRVDVEAGGGSVGPRYACRRRRHCGGCIGRAHGRPARRAGPRRGARRERACSNRRELTSAPDRRSRDRQP
jgi:Nucleotidyltransferase domain